jgi:hypothetical protein
MQRHIEFVVFYCFFFRVSPQEVQVHFVGRFIRRSSGDVQKRSRFIFLDASSENILEMYRRGPGSFFWTLHQKIFWRCTGESNETRPLVMDHE